MQAFPCLARRARGCLRLVRSNSPPESPLPTKRWRSMLARERIHAKARAVASRATTDAKVRTPARPKGVAPPTALTRISKPGYIHTNKGVQRSSLDPLFLALLCPPIDLT